MIGGDAAAVAAVKPVLACMGKNLFEVGSLGCGHAMKALNNFLAATSSAAGAEAIAIGSRFGLDPAVMTDVINASTGRSFVSENLIKQHVLSGAFATGFALGLLAKDVKIAADLAEQIGVDAPVGRLISELWSEARDALGGAQDHSRALAHWQQRAPRGRRRSERSGKSGRLELAGSAVGRPLRHLSLLVVDEQKEIEIANDRIAAGSLLHALAPFLVVRLLGGIDRRPDIHAGAGAFRLADPRAGNACAADRDWPSISGSSSWHRRAPARAPIRKEM